MGGEPAQLQGPDLGQGIPVDQVSDGASLLGHTNGEPVLLVHRGEEWFAISATCTHYGGPLAEGLIVGDTVRCPWHHACFSLRTGEPLRPPALNDVTCWVAAEQHGKVYVTGKRAGRPGARTRPSAAGPDSVVMVGAGAASANAAETLRREGYEGPITLIDPDDSAPYDRPNCSKDFLAGNAPEEWMPLHPRDWYRERGIELLGGRVAAIDPGTQRITLEDGGTRRYGALLLATGASPVRLPATLDRGELPVFYLRTLADSRSIIAAATPASRVVVLGASFIGLEVAASLRARKLAVHVVSPDTLPLERVIGPQLGSFVRGLHEEHGVVFHLEQKAREIGTAGVVLENGERVAADFIVAGIGVRPNVELAEAAGLAIDRGVSVNEFLETSAPGIFAAGDIARWPDPHTGERIRVEHWVPAERQGRAAARNILGRRERFDAVPFFWSQHYDVPIAYVGHAERWDTIEVDGDIVTKDCAVTFRRNGRTLAVATIYRDLTSLEAELAMERDIVEV